MSKHPRPLRIGLSANIFPPDPARGFYRTKELQYAEREFIEAVAVTGALPYMVTDVASPTHLARVMDDLDGLILTPGSDCSPKSYGQQPLKPAWVGDRRRDQFECTLVELAQERGKPILAVCRGLQLLNVALGGTLYQDIAHQRPNSLAHRDQQRYDAQGHMVRAAPNSWVAGVYGQTELSVNSVHHQGICDLAGELTATAWAPDGLIEGVEKIDADTFIVGVQWHPEWLTPQGPDAQNRCPGSRIFEAFMAEARRRMGSAPSRG